MRTPEDLLRPSLSRPAEVASVPYSTNTFFIVAFIGGPLSAALMFALNAWRLGRVAKDAVWVLLALALFAGLTVFLLTPDVGVGLKSALFEVFGDSSARVCMKALALAVFGVAWLCHRREQQSAQMFGLARPNPWAVGIGLIVLGLAVNYAVVAWRG